MKLVRFFMRYSRRTVTLAVAAGLLSGACTTGLIALVNSSLRSGGSLSTPMVLAFVALVVLLPLSRFSSETVLTHLGQGALYELRTKLSDKILAVPLQYLEHLGAHRVLGALTDDIPTITGALLQLPGICINVALLLGGIAYLGWLSPVMLLASLCMLGLGAAGYKFAGRGFAHHVRLAREDGDRLLKHFNALTEGTKELKLHHGRRSEFMTRTLRPTADSYRRHNVSAMAYHSVAASWGQTFIFVTIVLMVLFSARLEPTNPQVVTGYVIVLVYITSPLQVILNLMPSIARANVSVAKIERLGLELSANVERAAEAPAVPDGDWNELGLEGVTYSYTPEGDDTPFTLGPVDLTLRQGELVFITGGNGSGKTTFAKLLTGLYLPAGGTIYLNGRAVGEENVEHYRQHFSAVFSDFYLFDNFPGLDHPALGARVEEYLERLGLARKVRFDGGKLSTLKLSQGQRKRLALLTAYLEDRPIYLFDEWAADQDPHFKEVFYKHLLPELKERGKTVLVITHDDRYYHLADRLVRLEYGHISATAAPAPAAG
jgi:putative ATP-binding cassette transporter